MNPQVHIRVEGQAGRITLTRPAVLNALNHSMVLAISAALEDWDKTPLVKLIIIDGAGDRAFCAGGDIQAIYKTGRVHPDIGRRFWRDEYRLNARIRHYAKPFVAVMDRLVMGGGIGISAHGSHRIVTERSSVSMPETGIGFVPDVGCTRLLADAPGECGLHLGLTTARMDAADAIYAGFADVLVPSAKLANLVTALAQTGDTDAIAEFATHAPASKLASRQSLIDAVYGRDSIQDVVAALEGQCGTWPQETLAALRRVSPFAAAATFSAVRQAKDDSTLEGCLAREYRFAHRSLEGHDLYEGIRAAVIDKDRAPRWVPARIEDVSPESVNAAFAPLGEQEWVS